MSRRNPNYTAKRVAYGFYLLIIFVLRCLPVFFIALFGWALVKLAHAVEWFADALFDYVVNSYHNRFLQSVQDRMTAWEKTIQPSKD